jgi:hypothetical protein
MTFYLVGIGAICLLTGAAFLIAEGISPVEAFRLLASRWTSSGRR